MILRHSHAEILTRTAAYDAVNNRQLMPIQLRDISEVLYVLTSFSFIQPHKISIKFSPYKLLGLMFHAEIVRLSVRFLLLGSADALSIRIMPHAIRPERTFLRRAEAYFLWLFCN